VDAYLLLAVPKYSASFNQRGVAPNKYYAIDNGLRRVNSPSAAPDRGHRLENAVALALRHQGGNLAYAGEKNLWECDFVTDTRAIQVCAELTPENRPRELLGAVQAVRLPGQRKALILTLNQRDQLREQNLPIQVQPLWEWLLESA